MSIANGLGRSLVLCRSRYERSGGGHGPHCTHLASICLIATCLVGTFAGGCASVGPDYRAPAPVEASAWVSPVDDGFEPGPVDASTLVVWWETLDDPVLTGLVERALVDNPDLGAAQARFERSRAILGSTRATGLPAVDALGSAITTEASSQTSTGPVSQVEVYQVGFDAGWELDLFGRIRRSVEAATAEVEASAADLAAFRVSLSAEVGAAYIDLRTFGARLDLAESNLAAQSETFDLVSSRFEAGLVSRLDVDQAQSNLESTRSQIPTLRTGLMAARHRLAVLVGVVPGALELEVEGGTVAVPSLGIAVGVPAETLRRRPDVRAAERRVAAETARIGVAVAELYPRFALSGSIGLEALDLDGLTRSGASTFSFGPFVTWRIFDRRSIRAEIAARTAMQEEALRTYEGIVLGALEEAENALVAFAQERQRMEILRIAAGAAEQAEGLARDLYRSGLRTFQEVLDAQRTLLSLQDQLAASEGAVVTNLIRLYKALGGGWTPLEQGPASTVASPGQPPEAEGPRP